MNKPTKQELDEILKNTDFSGQVERIEAPAPGQARIAELEEENKRLKEYIAQTSGLLRNAANRIRESDVLKMDELREENKRLREALSGKGVPLTFCFCPRCGEQMSPKNDASKLT